MSQSKRYTRREVLKISGLVTTALAFPFPLISLTQFNKMIEQKNFDVIIIGGSYSGLSAAMTLGRALRNVLIIDSGKPCNLSTPHSHNFITQDGEKPAMIASKAKEQVLKYDTVKFYEGLAIEGKKAAEGFEISTMQGDTFVAKKLIFATGVKDIMPEVVGFAECWGISIIHCPYCHGYEVRNQKTGILANGDSAYHYAKLIRNWTKELTIFTNGKHSLTKEEKDKISEHNIPIIEKEIAYFQQENGQIQEIVFKDNSTFELEAIYSGPVFKQHCEIPEFMGCELTEEGHLKVDMFQKTTVEGVYACGDSTSPFRAVSYAVSTGTIVGAMANKELIEEEFY